MGITNRHRASFRRFISLFDIRTQHTNTGIEKGRTLLFTAQKREGWQADHRVGCIYKQINRKLELYGAAYIGLGLMMFLGLSKDWFIWTIFWVLGHEGCP